MARKKTRGRPPKLDLAQVMEVALVIADESGLDQLTIRGMARACDVTPMALYRHVKNASELETLAFRCAMERMKPPTLDGSWKDRVISIWSNFRELLHAHPGAAAIFAKRAMPTPEIVRATNALLHVLRDAGFEGDALFLAYDASFLFTLGSIRFERTRDASARTGLLDPELPPEDTDLIRELSPNMRARDADRQFRAGLAALLEGLAVGYLAPSKGA